MKTNRAIKEIKMLGIVMSILGVVLIFIGISSLPILSDVTHLIGLFLLIYGLMHIFKLERFE
jgi:uncharacterized membrane protein HdeD (DUF308 family)